jgi:hypothetical protein
LQATIVKRIFVLTPGGCQLVRGAGQQAPLRARCSDQRKLATGGDAKQGTVRTKQTKELAARELQVDATQIDADA